MAVVIGVALLVAGAIMQGNKNPYAPLLYAFGVIAIMAGG